MDANRFDELLRSFSETSSRRGAVRVLAGSALFGFLTLGSGDAEAHNTLKRCKKIEDKDKRQKCRKKAKRHNRRHANQPCVPACLTGQDCLANGSCAIPCTAPSAICPVGCFCGDPTTEGERYCAVGNTSCGVHAPCASTAACPRGEQCAPCGGNNHCLPLCPG